MRLLKLKSHWLIFVFFLLAAGLFIFFLNESFQEKEREASRLKLEYIHKDAVNQFSSSLDKFAGMVSGMRSYVNMSKDLPTATDFQQFVRNQFDDIKSQDSVVVSFIDTAHVFKQSFTRTSMNSANLVGKSVSSIRSKEKIEMLDQLMNMDSLRMFPPLNLLEGWVGLPINFRVHREGETLGYVAPILDFKSVIQSIYDNYDVRDDFVFHFKTKDGHDFDRYRVYNRTKVYSTKADPEYYMNYNTDLSTYIYSDIEYYGYEITLGTAYKIPYTDKGNFSLILLFWYLTFALLALVVTLQVGKSKKLNSELTQSNLLLEKRREEVRSQNKELRSLTATQNKFFSIIGHDMKQPLSAIEGLLYLLKEEKIDNPDLNLIINSLSESTGNTVNLLNNLLRWALSQTGEIDFILSNIEMNELILEVGGVLKHQALEKDIKLKYDLAENRVYRGDVQMLSTIIRNLISNAIKYSHPGSEVLIRSHVNEQFLVIKVKDSGVGMSEELIDSLFKLTDLVSEKGTKEETGTGLGLILCADFAKRHSGHIEVESKLNEGSEFSVFLPL